MQPSHPHPIRSKPPASRSTTARRLRGLVVGSAAFAATMAAAHALPSVHLRVAGHAITAEVARTPEQRETGLMERRSLPPDHGMLFVFRRDQDVCMWMKNTYLALSVAFIDARGRIVNVADMQPQTLDTHCAAGAVRYALEMPLGWFAEHHAGAGAAVRDLPASIPEAGGHAS